MYNVCLTILFFQFFKLHLLSAYPIFSPHSIFSLFTPIIIIIPTPISIPSTTHPILFIDWLLTLPVHYSMYYYSILLHALLLHLAPCTHHIPCIAQFAHLLLHYSMSLRVLYVLLVLLVLLVPILSHLVLHVTPCALFLHVTPCTPIPILSHPIPSSTPVILITYLSIIPIPDHPNVYVDHSYLQSPSSKSQSPIPRVLVRRLEG